MTNKKLPLVWFLGTGGTISDRQRQTITQNLDHISEVKKHVERVPDLHDFVLVKAEQLWMGGSGSQGPGRWLELAKKANTLVQDPDVDGIVVTHGTSSLEETAYWLNLTVRTQKPVVVTGAMRSPSFLGTDADNSLLNAAVVASTQESKGRGVLVVLNNEIHAAREVTKQNSYSRQTFGSREVGLLGYAGEEDFYQGQSDHRASYYRYPSRKHTYQSEFDVTNLSELPDVYIVMAYEGADGLIVRALSQAKAPGIVLAGMGAGGAGGQAQQDALAEASRQGTVVVATTRAGAGRVIRSEQNREHGWVAGDNLSPYKARILLQLALTKTRDVDEIQRMFETY